MNLEAEYTLSLYEDLKSIHKSRKSEIILVQNNLDEKFYIKRILKEYTLGVYKVLMGISSKNMPRIYEVFEYKDKLIIIEEFINGYTLQEILEKENELNEDRVIKYMIELCEALEKVHNLTPYIIHRDIKPANIIISNDEVLKLIDFDISRIYKQGENMDTTLLGTKGYASPEQFGFEQTDCRSDIYAIGVMMNVLSTGKHIKEKENEGKLKYIIKKCTKISASERYQNIEELKSDLESVYKNKSKKNIIDKNKEQGKEKVKSKYLIDKIPGFRNGKKLNMVIATLWYLFLIMGLIVSNSPKMLLENGCTMLILLALFLLYTNFLDIKSKLPMIRSDNEVIKIIGYFIYSFIIFMGFGIIAFGN
ncbi:serine/threonine-protein kinase [Paraclostridium sordellii]|uniref:serine/threonine-protein kinase n=1 Tax=Paraclostridium sordellii TaxID=1505 RepID=UPI0005E2861F|nr:serine/threonine-protein kinase [Paeniclostridium sordellii]CEO25734.1 serine/threonine-protein kinase Sps1 [[Clostridium] sordellii] [Paeniclostridium sordellii]